MKLFKLPFLCQKEVFNYIPFSTRYTFTFGTRRMKIWAKCLQKSSKAVDVQMEMKNLTADGTFSVKSGKQVEKIVDMTWSGLNPKNIRVMKFDDLELKCEVSFSPTISLKHNQRTSPTTRILESLCDFFNTTKEDIVYILNNFDHVGYLPPFPIQKSVLRLSSRLRNSNLIYRFYSSYSRQYFSMAQAERGFLDNLSINFQLLQIQNFVLTGIGLVEILMLIEFHGENAVFSGRRIETSTINQFLRFWLNGNLIELKTIIVEVTDPIQGNDIFAGIPHTKEETSVGYPYNSIIQDYYDFSEDTFDCSNTYSITRNAGSDSEKKATVKLTPNSFMFFVWD